MAKRNDEIGTSAMCRRLGIHRNTALLWMKKSIAGDHSKLSKGSVRRDLTGHYWVKKSEVDRLESMAQDYG